MKLANKIITIVCDDIREEKGNKLSLMGVYGEIIIVSQFPALLPTLGILVSLEGVQIKLSDIELILEIPGEAPQKKSMKINPGEIESKKNARFILKFSPFKIQEPGTVELKLRINDTNQIKNIHKFQVIQADNDPTLS